MAKINLEKMLKKCDVELKEMGATAHPRAKRYSDSFKKNVCSLIKSGEKLAIVSKRLEIPYPTIRRWLKDGPSGKKMFNKVQVVPDSTAYRKYILQTPSGCTVQFEHPQDLASVLKLLT